MSEEKKKSWDRMQKADQIMIRDFGDGVKTYWGVPVIRQDHGVMILLAETSMALEVPWVHVIRIVWPKDCIAVMILVENHLEEQSTWVRDTVREMNRAKGGDSVEVM